MERTECSETSAHKLQTRGITKNKKMQHSVHGESFKSGSS